MPPTATPPAQGGVTGLAKLGAMFLCLAGLLLTLLGVLTIAGGALLRDAIRNYAGPEFDGGQAGEIVGGVIAAVGIIVLVVAILEMLVGVFSFKGSGFARVLGTLYGLFFGLITLGIAMGWRLPEDSPGRASADAGPLPLVFAIGYLYTALVFILRYRGRA